MDEDFKYFRIYRGVAADFDPTGTEPLAETIENALTDSELATGVTYYYRVSAVDFNGNESAASELVSAPVLAVVGQSSIPQQFALHANYPNPFNPTSTIQYDIPEAANVTLVIYDILGREVIRLVDRQIQPGYHRAVWDAKDHVGGAMPTGIYFARLLTPDYTKSIKMLLLR